MPHAIDSPSTTDRLRSRTADGFAMASMAGACVGFATWMLVGPAPDEAGWESIRHARLVHSQAGVTVAGSAGSRGSGERCGAYPAPPAGCDATAASMPPASPEPPSTRLRTRDAGSVTRNVLPSPGRLSMPSSAW